MLYHDIAVSRRRCRCIHRRTYRQLGFYMNEMAELMKLLESLPENHEVKQHGAYQAVKDRNCSSAANRGYHPSRTGQRIRRC